MEDHEGVDDFRESFVWEVKSDVGKAQAQARSQVGVMGAIAPSAGPIAPSGVLLCILCT